MCAAQAKGNDAAYDVRLVGVFRPVELTTYHIRQYGANSTRYNDRLGWGSGLGLVVSVSYTPSTIVSIVC